MKDAPRPLPVKPENIPELLKGYRNFVCWAYEWKKGKWTKVPKNPRTGENAKSDDSSTWGTFEETFAYYSAHSNNGIAGIGFQLGNKDTPCVAWDFDHARNSETQEIDSEVMKKVRKLHSYTEISPSNKGIRVIAIGILPPEGRKKGDFECYDSDRYVTLTGHILDGLPRTIETRLDEVVEIHREIFGDGRRAPKAEERPASPVNLDDENLLNRARAAANGQLFCKLFDQGDTSNYPSPSEGDMALSMLLAFWCGRDPERMDRLVRQSGLYREKWDEKHHSDGSTYGQETIRRAIEITTETYNPSIPRDAGGEMSNENRSASSTGASAGRADVSPSVFSPLSRLLSVEDEQITYLVDRLILASANGWIGGEPKSLKSWLAIYLALCIAGKFSVFDHYAVPDHARVLYIQEEDGERRVRRRAKQILRGAGVAAPSDEFFRYSVKAGILLDDEKWLSILRTELTAYKPDIVIMDVFENLHTIDSNDRAKLKPILYALDRMHEEFDCGFLIVDHFKKATIGASKRGGQRLAGSTGKHAWGESSIYLFPGGSKGKVRVETELKDGPEETFTLALTDTDDGGVVFEWKAAEDEKETEMKAKILDAMSLDWMKATHVAELTGVSANTAKKYLDLLTDEGKLEKEQRSVGKQKPWHWRLTA